MEIPSPFQILRIGSLVRLPSDAHITEEDFGGPGSFEMGNEVIKYMGLLKLCLSLRLPKRVGYQDIPDGLLGPINGDALVFLPCFIPHNFACSTFKEEQTQQSGFSYSLYPDGPTNDFVSNG
ncbi:MAG: hypothetical protein R2791_07285 [Saprospiraceae bacterium]